MKEFEQLKNISEKIARVLDSVARNDGKFTSIEKDLLTNYMRDQYELILGVSVQSNPVKPAAKEPVTPHSFTTPPKDEIVVITEKPQEVKKEVFSEKTPPAADGPGKKSLSDLYSVNKENGKATVNDKFKKQGLEIADKLKQTPIKDLKSYIGLNKQFAFMSKLFNADEQLYEEAIAKLNGFKSYEEASGYIQHELLPSLHWSDDEPLVGEFFTLIMRRYLN